MWTDLVNTLTNQIILIHRSPLLCWVTSRTSRMRGEWTPTWHRIGQRMRRCVCGRCRWWSGTLWSNPLSTWPAKWPNHRASPLSLSVAIRIRAVVLQTAEGSNTVVMFKRAGKGTRCVLKVTILILLKMEIVRRIREKAEDCVEMYSQWVLLVLV